MFLKGREEIRGANNTYESTFSNETKNKRLLFETHKEMERN
jgi:hypothetical protein